MVAVPDISTLALISSVVAFNSISVSDTKSKTPSADWKIYVPESPNCNWSVEDNNNPVSATWVKVTSWSSPNPITAPSARYKSENSSEVVPRAAPSEASGTNAVVTSHVPVRVPPPDFVAIAAVLS